MLALPLVTLAVSYLLLTLLSLSLPSNYKLLAHFRFLYTIVISLLPPGQVFPAPLLLRTSRFYRSHVPFLSSLDVLLFGRAAWLMNKHLRLKKKRTLRRSYLERMHRKALITKL